MSDLKALIDELMSLRPNEEFALTFVPDCAIGPWIVDFINPHWSQVGIGETNGMFSGDGASPEIAVRKCIENVKAGRQNT